MNARRKDSSLRSNFFYTADGMIYFLDGGKPMLAITREENNPVFRNVREAYQQLTKKGNYSLYQREAEELITAESTEIFSLRKLRLNTEQSLSILEIDTNDSDLLNEEERRLAERVYGKENYFFKSMKLLRKAKIKKAQIHLLNPRYVQNKAAGGPLARASWLRSFVEYSNFDCFLSHINYPARLRGTPYEEETMLLDFPEQQNQLIDAHEQTAHLEFPSISQLFDVNEPTPEMGFSREDFPTLYDLILNNPDDALEKLDDETASKMLELLSRYYAKRK